MASQLQTALIKGKPLKYRVRRSRRARKFGVQVCKREGVVIILPQRAGLKAVPGLLEGWADWLDAKVDQFDVRYGPKVRQFGSGSEITILGRSRMLRFTDLPAGRKRPMITLTEDELRLALTPEDVFDPRPVLEKYLRKLAREDLNRRTRDWAAELDLWPRKIIVGERTSRWGSCSPNGTISYCYRLVMAPCAVVDAVVAHELCHLAHLNHGRKFYALLDRACPGHREAMTWLRDHEDDLIL